jgi:hypothetical protein
MAKTQEVLYAVVGAGELAVEKARGIRKIDRKTTDKVYRDLVKRGRSVSARVRNSGPTKQAIEQTKTARSQVKAAATGVRKAIRADAKAVKEAATKPTKATKATKAS